jgi:hypothetical protein
VTFRRLTGWGFQKPKGRHSAPIILWKHPHGGCTPLALTTCARCLDGVTGTFASYTLRGS